MYELKFVPFIPLNEGFQYCKTLCMADEDALKEPEGKQTIEFGCVGLVFGASGREKRNVGQLQRSDLHLLRRKGNVVSLQSVSSTAA